MRTGALTQKVREGGRAVSVHCLIATGINAAGYPEIPGIDVTTGQDGAGWVAWHAHVAAALEARHPSAAGHLDAARDDIRSLPPRRGSAPGGRSTASRPKRRNR